MANLPQARKRARQAETHRKRNASLRSYYRTAIKKVLKAVRAGDKDAAAATFKQAVPIIDSMVNKKILHKNKASRHKSRLNLRVKALNASG